MPEHVELQDVVVNGMIVKVGGDNLLGGVVRRVLHRREILDVERCGHHHDAAGVLPRGSFDAGAAANEPLFLGARHHAAALLEVFLHIAIGRLLCDGGDGAGPKHVPRCEQRFCKLVRLRLIFPGEVEVDVGNLFARKAHEGLKGDVKPVLAAHGAAVWADEIGHVAARLIGARVVKLRVKAGGADIVRRHGVDLCDAGKVGGDGGTHRAS